MRTTLSLDPDVAALLEKVRKTKGLSFKQAVNQALRTGLAQLTAPSPFRTEFHTANVDLGRCLIGNLDDISEALAAGEGEAFQ
jgi:hypothetical protein